jgi:hypothetical protein
MHEVVILFSGFCTEKITKTTRDIWVWMGEQYKMYPRENLRRCGSSWTHSGYGAMTGFCEHVNEMLIFIYAEIS